ncbi:hypothetical protein EJ04DRAFT_563749 [Polyplosphaeria fusca]|uniref:Uncharacterized protein n=1 Tax=Polyplosphaeria fusca TaxID=682080 RepID=A0A9P4R171_9PLEO|nr:hypothetical protein EJ04DRAFT_563749 [Polyplosphaeria fusca]
MSNDIDFSDLIAAAQNLEAPKPRLLTEDDIKDFLLPDNFRVYQYIIRFWNRFSI